MLLPTAGVQNFKPISLFWAVQWLKKQVRKMTSLFETCFLELLSVVGQENDVFWNHDTKLDKIGVYSKEIFDVQNLTFFT